MSQTYSVRQRFSIALKHEICDLVSSGEMSMTEARRHFHIKGHSTILDWMRKFGYLETHQAMSQPSKNEDPEALAAGIRALEAQLKEEKLKTQLLDAMIDIAEDQLNINIRKKSDTKQSNK